MKLGAFAKHGPVNVRTKLFAPDRSVSQSLDIRALVSRGSSLDPLMNSLRRNTNAAS